MLWHEKNVFLSQFFTNKQTQFYQCIFSSEENVEVLCEKCD